MSITSCCTMSITSQLPECVLFPYNSITYSCDNPYPNCSNPAAFQFTSLWIITQAIYNSCSNDTRLFQQGLSLTQEACEIFAGGDAWTLYPHADIWARLTTWKFPLLQLVAVFPRPPLSLLSEFFVLIHVMGDPVSTISNLLLKVASCQNRAALWKDLFSDGGKLEHLLSETAPKGRKQEVIRIWKGLAAIADSYDEWGQQIGNDAEDFILGQLLSDTISLNEKRKFLELCQLAANALAADRASNFLPVVVALCFFIGTVGIAVGRTRSSASGPNPATFVNVEAYSIAFSAPYFYIIPAVLLSSIIGVSQTENAIPRILSWFRKNVEKELPQWTVTLPDEQLSVETSLRERKGGIYSWQPHKPRREVQQNILHRKQKTTTNSSTNLRTIKKPLSNLFGLQPGSETLPFIILTSGTFTGLLIAYLVPPIGLECRHIGLILMYLVWVLSSLLNHLPFPSTHSVLHFRLILFKDLLSTSLTMSGIAAGQIGVFNRCSCYTLWGRTGLALPEIPEVESVLMKGIGSTYPVIAFLGVGWQLGITGWVVGLVYEGAVRVFLQRDTGRSNLGWLDRIEMVPRALGRGGRWVWDGSLGFFGRFKRKPGGIGYERTESLSPLYSTTDKGNKRTERIMVVERGSGEEEVAENLT